MGKRLLKIFVRAESKMVYVINNLNMALGFQQWRYIANYNQTESSSEWLAH